jgi:hypothetical protein
MTFLNEKDLSLLSNHQIDNQIIVEYPNSTTATSIGSGLYQPALGISPIPAAVFANSNLQRSLIGLGDICHNDQEIKLTETAMEISKGNKILLRTTKLPTDKFWTFPGSESSPGSSSSSPAQASHMIRHDLQASYVEFMSAAFGSPTDETLINALTYGWLGNIPKLTAKMVRRHKPNSLATAKGHLDLQRKGVNSTKPKKVVPL